MQYMEKYKLVAKKSHKLDNICLDIFMAYNNGDIQVNAPKSLIEFKNPSNADNVTEEATQFLEKILVLDYVIVIWFIRRGQQPRKC